MFRRIFCVSLCLTGSLFAVSTTLTVGVATDIDMATGGLDMGTPATTDLRGALNHVNLFPNPDGYIIHFTPNLSPITLGAMLPILNLVQSYPLTIDGEAGVTIDGDTDYRGFFAQQGPITLKNIHFQNFNAAGGNGGDPGGGGGMGAGAALFVNRAQVTLSHVTMNACVARGGRGGVNAAMASLAGGSGGGGLGGHGADGPSTGAYGGGGGLGGEGGFLFTASSSGGGGINCGTDHTGEGAGTLSQDGAQGGAIGSTEGGGSGTEAGSEGGPLGGGGGRSSVGSGAAGGGGIGGFDGIDPQGGKGGYFGGGGGANSGGDGGFGGGGGGGEVRGGNGNFGGGGGSVNLPTGHGGAGGFGGGGGGCRQSIGSPGVGGVGGGAGTAINFGGWGGGGAGFGGAMFINDTGTLIIQDSFSAENNSTQAGNGLNPGWAAGDACFIVTGALVILDPNGSSLTFSQSIADDSAASFSGALPGTRTGSASGATIFIGQEGSAPGTVIFSSTNHSTYGGPTIVQKGIFSIDGSIASPVTVTNGAKLNGTGIVSQSVTVEAGGHFQAGHSIGSMTLGSLVLENSQSVLELDVDLSPGSSLSSFYTVIGPVTLNQGILQLNATQSGSQNNYTYDFLSFLGGNPGVFGTIVSVPGYYATVTKTFNLLTLHLSLYSTVLGVGVSLSENQQTILSYLLGMQTIPSLQSVLSNLAALSPDSLRAALDHISPARNEAAPYFASQTAFGMGLIPLARLRDQRILDHMAAFHNANALSAALLEKSESLIASSNEEDLADLFWKKNPAGRARTSAAKPENYGFWVAGFGNFLSQEGQHSNPKIHDTAAGTVIGFDYYGMENGLFTLSSGYLHNDMTTNGGNGTSNGAMLSLYGTGYIQDGYLEAGAFGGYNRFHMNRSISIPGSSPISLTAKSSFNTWVFMPHLGGGYDWVMDWGVVEPFASLDWAISFQEGYREKGASPLNAKIASSSPSILRSQIGCNVYETWDWSKGIAILQESLSYVNKALFDTHMKSAILVPTAISGGTPGSFTLQTYDRTLNLFGAGLEVFYKHKPSGFFVSTAYQGEFGSGYMSNEVIGTLGVFF